jgi:hypothetical protein
MSKPKLPQNEAERRQQRLAAALRDNLKRRKAQARARSDAPEGQSTQKPKNTPPAKG